MSSFVKESVATAESMGSSIEKQSREQAHKIQEASTGYQKRMKAIAAAVKQKETERRVLRDQKSRMEKAAQELNKQMKQNSENRQEQSNKDTTEKERLRVQEEKEKHRKKHKRKLPINNNEQLKNNMKRISLIKLMQGLWSQKLVKQKSKRKPVKQLCMNHKKKLKLEKGKHQQDIKKE